MTGQSNLAELQILLQKKFLIRRTKEQVLTNLESKTRSAVLLMLIIFYFEISYFCMSDVYVFRWVEI